MVKEEEERIEATGAIFNNPLITEYVNDVASRLLPPEVKHSGFSVRVKIINNPLFNAFAYPNGVIYVHSGILSRMENEAQLATLLGHEMVHAINRHAIQQAQGIKRKGATLATVQLLTAPFGIFGAIVNTVGTFGYVASVSGLFPRPRSRG